MTSSTSPSPNYPACLADMSAATLFICELMPHVNEVVLYKKFAPMGTVTSVKLCRDWVTGKSLCYAYVNFENPAEAEKAYRSLNYELLEGKPMRIMKSTRNPWLQSRDEGCCYHHHHHHHHRCCGAAAASKDLMDPQTLVEAIETYSRAFKDVEEHKGPTGYKYSKEFLKRMNIANTQYTNVFIKNFKDLLDDYKLYRLCKPFGEVTSAKVMVDEYGISKGFGFACFTDSDAAQRAVNKLNGLMLDGRTLFAGPALTKSERVKDWTGTRNDNDNIYNNKQEPPHVSFSPRICIRNLRDVVDEVRLRKEFERFGPVQQVELLVDNDGQSKGTGYVMYEDQADAIKAVNSMNGKMIYGTRIGVNYVPYTATAATNTSPDNFLASLTTGEDGSPAMVRDNAGLDSGDNNESSSGKVFLQLKDMATSLASRGHPVNIKDIDKHFNNSGNNSVYKNSSTTREMNTSNNAVKMASVSSTEGGIGNSSSSSQICSRQQMCFTDDGTNAVGETEYTMEEEGEGASDGQDTKTGMATLLVKNLDESITDYKLESLFNVYGRVVSAKVISNEFGVSKGFGFVIMEEADDAVRAIKNLDGRIVVNRPVYISPTAQTRLSSL